MAKIGTMTTGAASVDSFNLTYVPQYLFYVAATQISALRVSVLGDGVITDLDDDGLNLVYNIRQFGQVTNGYLIPLADGLIPGKNVEIITTNSAAQTPTLYGISMQYGSAYIQCLKQTAIGNSGVNIEKFAYLGIDSLGATDIINISYADGMQAKVEAAELPAMAGLVQSASLDVIDNVESMIDLVQFTPAADRKIYVVRYSGKELNQAMS